MTLSYNIFKMLDEWIVELIRSCVCVCFACHHTGFFPVQFTRFNNRSLRPSEFSVLVLNVCVCVAAFFLSVYTFIESVKFLAFTRRNVPKRVPVRNEIDSYLQTL